jgi:hypothetical protein
MPFIGKQPQTGAYSKLDAITTSATATYNLTLDGSAYYPQSANHLLVSLNGVMQAPQDSFTVSGSQITFASALTSSDSIDFIMALGDTLDIGVPSAGSVNTSQLANDAVTVAKWGGGQLSGKRNLVINGGMQVAQRATSVTGQNSSGYFTVDRMYVNHSGGTFNMSQEETSNADRETTGQQNYLRLNATTGDNNMALYYYAEAKDAAHFLGKKFTASFWAKGTNPNGGEFDVFPNLYDGTNGSNEPEQSLVLTSSWTYYTFTFDTPDIASVDWTNSNTTFQFVIRQPTGDASTNAWTLDITGLQIEVGEEASPFEHRSYGDELALCQRYTVVYNYDTFENTLVFPGMARAGTTKFFHITLPQSMRDATPSLSLTGEVRLLNHTTSQYKDATDTLTIGGITPSIKTSGHGLTLYYSGTMTDITSTQNAIYQLMFVGDTGHQLIIDGEL